MVGRHKNTTTTALFALFAVVFVVGGVFASDGAADPELSLEELLAQNAECNTRRSQGPSGCTSSPTKKCCYFRHYSNETESLIPQCIGLDVYKKMYAVNETQYLRQLNLSNFHSSIKTESFCSIIAVDPNWQRLRSCACVAGLVKVVIGLVGLFGSMAVW